MGVQGDGQWYVQTNGDAVGPMTLEALRTELQHRPDWKSCFVMHEGMVRWELAGDVAELSRAIVSPASSRGGARSAASVSVSQGSAASQVAPTGAKRRWSLGRIVALIVVVWIAVVIFRGFERNAGQSAATVDDATAIAQGFQKAVDQQRGNLPRKVDDKTTLVDISASGTTFTYDYVVSAKKEDIDAVALVKQVQKQVCGNASMKTTVIHGGVFRYRYADESRAVFSTIEIGKADCV